MRRTSSRLAVLAALLCVLLGVPSTALGEARAMAPSAAGDGSVSDPNISYVGRWDLSSDVAVPNWAGAYFETKFTGTTVSLKQRDAVNLYASIDGGPLVFYPAVEGTVNLTPEPLDAGTHTLQVTYRSGDTVFQGLALEEGARTVDPELSPKLVEFVGDSITAGATSSKEAASGYGYVLGEQLGVRHTQIAVPGTAWCPHRTVSGRVHSSSRSEARATRTGTSPGTRRTPS